MIECKFKYKANRKYVHGTDLYKQLDEHILINCHNIKKIDFTINKVITNECDLYSEEELGDLESCSRLVVREGGESKKFFYVESERKVTENYIYDEELVGKKLIIDGESALLQFIEGYSSIELIVASQKALLESMRPAEGKWFFTRLEITDKFDNKKFNILKLNLIKNFKNRLFKTQVVLDDKDIGFIYFSLV